MQPLPKNTPAGSIWESALEARPEFGLVAGRPWDEAVRRLEELDDETLLGAPVRDPLMAQCVRSGLLLRAEQFDASHDICQGIKTAEGSYWHGILHRREPDASNAKYWFRNVGDHPVWVELAEQIPGDLGSDDAQLILADSAWDPFHFVDLCAASSARAEPSTPSLERAQELELALLLEWSFRKAIT